MFPLADILYCTYVTHTPSLTVCTHFQTLLSVLHPGATVAFLAALLVPSHFPPLQHLGLFNKEASRERRGAGRESRVSIQFCLNYPRVCVPTLIKEQRRNLWLI